MTPLEYYNQKYSSNSSVDSSANSSVDSTINSHVSVNTNSHIASYNHPVISPNKNVFSGTLTENLRNLAANALEVLIKFTESKYFKNIFLILTIGLILFYYFGSNMLAVVFSIIAILCFLPMMLFPMVGMEFGFSAMLIISSIQGFGIGFIVGKVPNLIGHIATMQIDMDLVYEFFIYIPIAYIASLFPLHMMVPIGITLTVLYNIGYIFYFQIMGILNVKEVLYASTNCLFNIFILTYLVPLLLKLGF